MAGILASLSQYKKRAVVRKNKSLEHIPKIHDEPACAKEVFVQAALINGMDIPDRKPFAPLKPSPRPR
jgi:hypothetical protein